MRKYLCYKELFYHEEVVSYSGNSFESCINLWTCSKAWLLHKRHIKSGAFYRICNRQKKTSIMPPPPLLLCITSFSHFWKYPLLLYALRVAPGFYYSAFVHFNLLYFDILRFDIFTFGVIRGNRFYIISFSIFLQCNTISRDCNDIW